MTEPVDNLYWFLVESQDGCFKFCDTRAAMCQMTRLFLQDLRTRIISGFAGIKWGRGRETRGITCLSCLGSGLVP